MTINDINQIEKQNKININLFGYDIVKKSTYSVKISKEHYDDHLELLYLEGENELKKLKAGSEGQAPVIMFISKILVD